MMAEKGASDAGVVADPGRPGYDERVGVGVQATSKEQLLSGLRARPKTLSSKYHYDERGSKLFARITELDEYYLTRRERALLQRWMPAWVSDLRPAALVELGAGSSDKSRIVLDAMVQAGCGRAYVPVDVSAEFLARTAEALTGEYPSLEIAPEVADFTEPLDLPAALPRPRWVAFLGSTLGNFEPPEALSLLSRIAARLGHTDRFLLGVDLRPGEKKSAERIELAYNDAEGVTAAFSLNLLSVLNEEFGADFDLSGYEHRSWYNIDKGRIETFLLARRAQTVRLPNVEPVQIAAGELIRTEISAKYDRPTVEALFERAGLRLERWIEDEDGYYALVLGAPKA
jgi:L-histidine N-alpha-methyltransferase